MDFEGLERLLADGRAISKVVDYLCRDDNELATNIAEPSVSILL
jgi:hypothetical protein